VLNTENSVYNAYPGYFDAMAWLCSVLGIQDPLALATFWPPLLALFRVVVLRCLAGRFLKSRAQCWVAVALTVLADTIGADYFSPQSVGYVFGLATVAIALSRHRHVPRLTMVLVGGVVLAVSHQLSPFVVAGVLAVLVVFRLLRPWWTPLLVLLPAVVWALLNFSAIAHFVNFESFGSLSNFRAPTVSGVATLPRLPVVPQTVWTALGAIGVVGCLALVTLLRNRRRARAWALACCPAVGLILIAVQPYGQEGIFRAALFGIPWLAILAAPLLASPRPLPRAALAAVAVLLTPLFLVASFGLDAFTVIRPSDYAAARQFRALGGANPPEQYVLLTLSSGDVPTSPDAAGGHHPVWGLDVIKQEPGAGPKKDARSEMLAITRAFSRAPGATGDARLYALWSPAGALYEEAYGLRSVANSDDLRDAFTSSGFWKVERREDGTLLLRLDRARYRAATGG
jgi:hypothetical protein